MNKSTKGVMMSKIKDSVASCALERFARENSKLDAENRLLKEDIEFIKMSRNSGLHGDSAIVSELQRQLNAGKI